MEKNDEMIGEKEKDPEKLKNIMEGSEMIEKTDEIKSEDVEKAEKEMPEPSTTNENVDFAQMLEDSLLNIPQLQVGDKIEGEILNITDSYIFISIGGKRDAYAEKADYLDKSGKIPFKVGDNLSGYVTKYTETETLISKSLVSVNKRILREAFEEKIPVNGKIVSLVNRGYLVDISGVRAFCPMSHIDNKFVKDPKEYLGQSLDFIIKEFKENGRNIVVSRKVILDEEKNKLKNETLSKIELDSVVKGKVTRLTNFGAFIDLGGIEGLLHISQFSWARVESPSEILNIGDEIEAKIINIKGEKISLSLKALVENPFEQALDELKEGDAVSCRVLRNQPFGSFVEIIPGVEGLIPISELALGRRVNNPSEIVSEGDFVEAQIMRINHERKKISLSLKALQPDPWDDIEEIIAENDIITGKIENVVNFGVFIKIKDGVDGLLPSSKIKLANLKLDKTNIGEELKVRVVRIDREKKRISLEPTNLPESAVEAKDDWHKYKRQKKKKEVINDESPFAHL